MKIKQIFILLISLSIATFANAQKGKMTLTPGMLKALSADLNLSEDQIAKIDQIIVEFRESRKELRNSEVENPEERRTQMKALMQSQKTALQELLTTEQLNTLAERDAKMKEERKAEMKAKRKSFNSEHKKAMKDEVKAYKAANVDPVIDKQRIKLDEKISQEDKIILNELRSNRKTNKGNRKRNKAATKDQMKKDDKVAKKPKSRSEDSAKLRALVEKYDNDIQSLFDEIKPQTDQWMAEIKTIEMKYAANKKPEGDPADSELKANNKKSLKKKKRNAHKTIVSKAKFLLMDPFSKDSNVKIRPAPPVKSEDH